MLTYIHGTLGARLDLSITSEGLHINGQLIPGALAYIWDELTTRYVGGSREFPDPSLGAAGAHRRGVEIAGALQARAEYLKEINS